MTLLFFVMLILPLASWANPLQFTAEESHYLSEKKEILMCIDPNWLPYEKIENGQHIGMTKDYMDIFSSRLGIPISLVATSTWSESLEYARTRKCDIFSLAMATPEREKYMNFTQPYLSIPLVVATRIDQLFILNFYDVKNKKLGIVKGYAFAELLKIKYPDLQIIEVESIDEGLDKVSKGKLFGFIGSLSSIGYVIQREYIGELKIAGKFDEKWELGVGVRNDDPLMLAVFKRVIDSVDYAEKQKIMNKWLSVKYDHGTDYSLIWKILAVVSIVVLILLYHQMILRKYNKELEALAVTDKLTGLYNRFKLDETIEQSLDNYNRYEHKFFILMLDLDFFKSVNDLHGHQIGDQILIKVASILKATLRKTDIIGRWGGEEFLIIVPAAANEIVGVEVAEKIRKSFLASQELQKYAVTASIGVAEVNHSDNFNSIVKRADDALYKAKNNGRNRVEKI